MKCIHLSLIYHQENQLQSHQCNFSHLDPHFVDNHDDAGDDVAGDDDNGDDDKGDDNDGDVDLQGGEKPEPVSQLSNRADNLSSRSLKTVHW